MEDQKPVSIGKVAFQYGVLAGIILIVISIIFYVAGQEHHWTSSLITYLILFGAIVYGLKNYRDELLDGYIKYARALGFGVLLSLFAGIVLGLYTFVFYKFINPEALDTLIREAQQSVIEARPDISNSELDMAMSFSKAFINPYFFFVSSVLSTTFFGTIFSLIIAAIFKNEAPVDVEE